MLGVLAIVMAGVTLPLSSLFAAVLMLSTFAAAVVVVRSVLGEGSPLLAMTAVPPLTVLALLIADPAAIWGNFPPSPRAR